MRFLTTEGRFRYEIQLPLLIMCYFEAWNIIENSSEKQINKQTNKKQSAWVL